MDKIKLEILGLSSSQSQTGSFALVLGEEMGNRRLPIIIGVFEAQAIALELERIPTKRPMTHDLFKAFADSFNYTVEEIIIADLREGVFFARIVCSNGIETYQVDARPSDAIAIGLRFSANIYTYENILSEAGIILSDYLEEEPTTDEIEATPQKKSWHDSLKEQSSEQLQQMLDEALNAEDYEKAAKIRDELNRRN